MAWTTAEIPDQAKAEAARASSRSPAPGGTPLDAMATLWVVSERETGNTFDVKPP